MKNNSKRLLRKSNLSLWTVAKRDNIPSDDESSSFWSAKLFMHKEMVFMDSGSKFIDYATLRLICLWNDLCISSFYINKEWGSHELGKFKNLGISGIGIGSTIWTPIIFYHACVSKHMRNMELESFQYPCVSKHKGRRNQIDFHTLLISKQIIRVTWHN